MSQVRLLPTFHLVGFTGHRSLGHPEAVRASVRAVLTALQTEGPGTWVAVSSCAAGSDLIFARESLALGLGWELIVPLPLAEFRKDFSDEDWREAESLVGRAETTTILNHAGAREDAYFDAGMETVNGCDVLIAVWDGKPARGKGGTADMVGYARALGRPLVLIDSETGETRREGFERLAWRDAELEWLNALPPVPTPAAPGAASEVPAALTEFLHRCDHAATVGAPQFRRLTASVVWLHAVATVVAAAGLSFGLHWLVLPWIKLSGVVGALAVALWIRFRRAQDRWVRCRLAAELVRSTVATWGLRKAGAALNDSDLGSIQALTRTLEILRRRAARAAPVPLEAFKARYLSERVEDQRAYYARQLARALPQLGRLRTGFTVATVLAIVCTAAYAVDHTFHLGWLEGGAAKAAYYFLPIALPVVASVCMAMIAIHDLHRRVGRYREMLHLLEGSRKQAEFAQSWESLERVVANTERSLLQEVVEWRTLVSHLESH
jgi:hypothetical protein